MGRSSFFAPGYGFLWGLVLLFILGCTKADIDTIKEVTDDATRQVNLSPFQQWRSSYECLQSTTSNCTGLFRLTEGGWVNVTSEDTAYYCKQCADHTRAVIKCISLVKPDYKFRNTATVKDINDTINHGCSSHFTGVTQISSARMIYVGKTMMFISILAAWLFMTI